MIFVYILTSLMGMPSYGIEEVVPGIFVSPLVDGKWADTAEKLFIARRFINGEPYLSQTIGAGPLAANDYCQQTFGTSLATVTSQSDKDVFDNLLNALSKRDPLRYIGLCECGWIGAQYDVNDAKYEYMRDDSALQFDAWLNPTEQAKNQCILSYDGSWRGWGCNNNNNFIICDHPDRGQNNGNNENNLICEQSLWIKNNGEEADGAVWEYNNDGNGVCEWISIHATNAGPNRAMVYLTNGEYSDFELTVKIKLTGFECQGGISIRSSTSDVYQNLLMLNKRYGGFVGLGGYSKPMGFQDNKVYTVYVKAIGNQYTIKLTREDGTVEVDNQVYTANNGLTNGIIGIWARNNNNDGNYRVSFSSLTITDLSQAGCSSEAVCPEPSTWMIQGARSGTGQLSNCEITGAPIAGTSHYGYITSWYGSSRTAMGAQYTDFTVSAEFEFNVMASSWGSRGALLVRMNDYCADGGCTYGQKMSAYMISLNSAGQFRLDAKTNGNEIDLVNTNIGQIANAPYPDRTKIIFTISVTVQGNDINAILSYNGNEYELSYTLSPDLTIKDRYGTRIRSAYYPSGSIGFQINGGDMTVRNIKLCDNTGSAAKSPQFNNYLNIEPNEEDRNNNYYYFKINVSWSTLVFICCLIGLLVICNILLLVYFSNCCNKENTKIYKPVKYIDSDSEIC